MNLHIEQLSHQHALWAECRMIRQRVFIEEQQVPIALEWDVSDQTALHLLALTDSQPAGCARVLTDGHIGRMAVLAPWRGKGVGEALLHEAVQVCRQLEVTHARLSAQTHAIDFYARAGFVVCSAPYLDANIMHVDMQLELV
ncbi:MAG: GNAT family N-acetyltransferase [Methylophilus sp.]|uniref:GNAT family N-acetyltransferase n=1 Tax=Methylophilus sp. TaxID=29541 RepID=UPI003FA08748